MMYAIDPTMSFAQVVQYYKDYVKRTKSYGQTGILPAICNRQILKSDDPVAKKPPAHPIFCLYHRKATPHLTLLRRNRCGVFISLTSQNSYSNF